MNEMRQFLDNSYLFGGNAPFVEELYEQYLADPASVPGEWRAYFDKLLNLNLTDFSKIGVEGGALGHLLFINERLIKARRLAAR